MALNINKPFSVVTTVDPAIDTEAMYEHEMVAYMNERDVSMLKLKQGRRPTTFTMRELSHETVDSIQNSCSTERDIYTRAFRAAVFEIDFEDRSIGKLSPTNPKIGFTIDETRCLRPAVIQDIGGVAWARSFLGPEIVRHYPRQQLLLAHLAALPYRSVERNDADPSKNKDSATQESADHVEPKQDAISASPTVAHATAETSHPAA